MSPAPLPPPDASRSRKAEEVFFAAVELAEPVARAALVVERCGDDRALRAEVEALLQAHDSPVLAERAVAAPVEQAGDRIGRYRLLQEIGQGGFGIVWMAEQVEPVTRRVALKVLKLGMDTREVVARFEQERQALAMMDHPNIARVFDAGATATGRPFFVMELVKGVPITQFCDERQLGTRQRLQLFGDLCGAINHAHQKGIIHRDIKPSNVMVTLHGDQAVVKVIDFGIAKAMQGRLTEKTLFTRFEQFVGTPVYMSPEQAVRSGLDVDTRSDIYALGMLLYELLTGRPPFDQKALVSAGYEEMLRIIREVEPPRPSSRLSTIGGAELESVARARHIDGKDVARLIEPDLDWIVMKAIEKDRTRRYETANGLLRDIQRFLVDEPVSASPPGAGYLFRKFVRRHKGALRAAAALTVVLLAATTISVWLAVQATNAQQQERAARVDAVAALERATASERLARDEATKSAQSAKFIQSLLTGLDPVVAQGRDPTLLAELLLRAGRRAASEFQGQPEVHLEVLATIGHGLAQLGWSPYACEIARQALVLGEKVYGPDNAKTAKLLTVSALRSLHYGQHAQAEALAMRAVAIQRRVSGAEHHDTLEAISELGFVLAGIGKAAAAETVLREHLAIAARVLPADGAAIATARMTLARALAAQARHAEAVVVLRVVIASCARSLGDCAERTVHAENVLVDELLAQHADSEAAMFARQCVERLRTARAEHGEGVQMMHRLGRLVLTDEGAVILRDALEMARRVLGAHHPGYVAISRDLAARYQASGRTAEADALLQVGVVASADASPRLESSLEPLQAMLRADPTDAHAALKLAARQAWLGRSQDWLVTARAILDSVHDTAHRPSAERAAKAATIIPGADAAMLAQARRLAQRALEDQGSILLPWFQFCAGLVEFRAGDVVAAELILSQIRLEGVYERLAVVPIYRAMIAIRQSRLDDARTLLGDARGMMRPLPADAETPFAAGGDHDDLITWMAWNEAQAMLAAGK